jgi:hypothetical protein
VLLDAPCSGTGVSACFSFFFNLTMSSEFDIILAFLVPYVKVSSEEFEDNNKYQACVGKGALTQCFQLSCRW